MFVNKTKKENNKKLFQVQQLHNFQNTSVNSKNLKKLQDLIQNKSKIKNGILIINLYQYKSGKNDLSEDLKNLRMQINLKIVLDNKATLMLNEKEMVLPKGESVFEINIIDTTKVKLKMSSANLDVLKIKSCSIDEIKIKKG